MKDLGLGSPQSHPCQVGCRLSIFRPERRWKKRWQEDRKFQREEGMQWMRTTIDCEHDQEKRQSERERASKPRIKKVLLFLFFILLGTVVGVLLQILGGIADGLVHAGVIHGGS